MKQFIFFFFILALFSCKNKNADVAEDNAIIETSDSILIAFNERIKTDPSNPELYHARARYFLQQKNADAAFADMGRVLKLDTTKADYFITLSEIAFTRGQGATVKSALEKAIEVDPDNIEALMKLGELHLYLKNYKEAMGYLDRVLMKDRYNAKAYFIKGMAFKETGDTARAVSSFQTTVEQDPDYYHAYMQLGLLFSDAKKPLALDYLNNALNLDPESIEALYAIGFFAQENNMPEKAIQAYNTILQIDSAYKHAHYNLGYVQSELLKNYKAALKHYSDAIRLYPDFYEAWYMRGYTYERMGDKTSAAADYRASLNIKPDYDLAALGLGRVETGI